MPRGLYSRVSYAPRPLQYSTQVQYVELRTKNLYFCIPLIIPLVTMSTCFSSSPLSPSKRGNRCLPEAAKRLKSDATAGPSAPSQDHGMSDAPQEVSVLGEVGVWCATRGPTPAEPREQTVEGHAPEPSSGAGTPVDYVPRGLAALSEVDTKWHLQLHVRCEGALEFETERKEEYVGDAYASRDLIMSGNASAFDLVKAMLLAFGINKEVYNHHNLMGSLGLKRIVLRDVLATSSGTNKSVWAVGPIAGISRPKKSGGKAWSDLVSATDLKKVKLAQLLDKPWYPTDTRSNLQGTRSRIWMLLDVPDRVGFVSSRGGALLPVKRSLYGFAVLCVAIGSKADTHHSCQSQLPRCVGGTGAALGGNDFGDDDDDDDCELDDLNMAFGNGRQLPGGEDREEMLDLLSTPLFELEETDDGGGTLIHSDDPNETRRQRAVRSSEPPPASGCIIA